MTEQQVFLQFYEVLISTEIKGFIIQKFVDQVTKQPLTNKNFKTRMSSYDEFLYLELPNTSRYYLRCNPFSHIEDETFVRLTRVYEGYIDNERNLNDDDSCYNDCDYTKTKSFNCKDNTCFEPQCNGEIFNCLPTKLDTATTCASHGLQLKKRRYEFVSTNSKTNIDTKNCSVVPYETRESLRFLFLCSYCFCFCDDKESEYSDRFFDLRGSMTNLDENRIVTGVRFVKQKQVIYLQIQDGVLLKGGNVDVNSIRWQPVSDYDVWNRRIKMGIDYYSFSPIDNERMSLDLDNIQADQEFLITGMPYDLFITL